MENRGGTIIEIGLDELLTTVLDKRNHRYRLAQICCYFADEKYHLSYSFAHHYELITYRIVVDKETMVPSITNIYNAAFLYENEMKELFGVNIEYISMNYKNKLYLIDVEAPFIKKEEK